MGLLPFSCCPFHFLGLLLWSGRFLSFPSLHFPTDWNQKFMPECRAVVSLPSSQGQGETKSERRGTSSAFFFFLLLHSFLHEKWDSTMRILLCFGHRSYLQEKNINLSSPKNQQTRQLDSETCPCHVFVTFVFFCLLVPASWSWLYCQQSVENQ